MASKQVDGADDSLLLDIEGIKPSGDVGDIRLAATFTPDDGSGPFTNLAAVTVIQVNDVLLPGAPNDGLVVLRGTSVALDMDVVPSAAKDLLSTVYNVRRLRGDGTYEDWHYAAGNYNGTTAIYNPSEGGIYQVQAAVGVGWGGSDERYYVWEDYSDYVYGIKVPGDMKAFGVCDEEWQKTVRNNAKAFLGDASYGFGSSVGAYEGFSSVGNDTWKCNVFVAHRLVQSQLPVPAIHHGRFNLNNWPPLANEWGDELFEIEHWTFLGSSSYPQPGMVAIRPSDGPNGHMGILDFDGMAISAQADIVTRASSVPTWGNAVYRRYTNE